MRKLLFLIIFTGIIFTGCSRADNSDEEVNISDNLSDNFEIDGKVKAEDSGMEYFTQFFEAYKTTEGADSFTKDKMVEMNMFEETDDPYLIVSKTHIQRVKNGDSYDANFILDDNVDNNKSKTAGSFTNDMIYFETEDGSYKQDSTWNDLKYMIDGYSFKLYDYTVSDVKASLFDDGSIKLDMSFNLQNLSEAPDEEIFEILSATATTYKNLSFNDAYCEAYIDPEGYVSGYKMYYDGQVVAGEDPFTFKYTTTVKYSDINKTKVSLPENTDDYEYIEPETTAE